VERKIVTKPHYRAIFVSDIHLGSSASQTELLLSFLEHVKTDKIYLVGDIIDLWALKRSWYWSTGHNEVVRKLLKFADKGIPLTYVIGNHDELLRFLVGFRFGNIEICKEAEHQTLDGRNILIIHGDAFDNVLQNAHWLGVLGSHAYDYLVTINLWFNRVRALFGRPYWSLAGYLKRQVKEAGAFIEKFEIAVTDEAKHRGFDGVICGHIHKADVKLVDQTLYANIGDGVDSCCCLVETDEGNLETVWWTR
jgi:UDP-2,3-diacylglucosamine pyrophosphatase LpxH